MKNILLLGSTGSIGRQTLDIIGHFEDAYKVSGLSCLGCNLELFVSQIKEFKPRYISIAQKDKLPNLVGLLRSQGLSMPEFVEDFADISLLKEMRLNVVINAVSGSVGLKSTLATLEAKIPLALANKESLVAGGALVREVLGKTCGSGADRCLADRGLTTQGLGADLHSSATRDSAAQGSGASSAASEASGESADSRIPGSSHHNSTHAPLVPEILPLDSEHSAIWQAMRGNRYSEVSRIILTASGGPFFGKTLCELEAVRIEDALKHPTWNMGKAVTINSSTLVNKGLELIEACLLFGIEPDNIVPVVHRQSIVHSMVEFADGSTIAQASPPDMRLPISYALNYPTRTIGLTKPIDWTKASAWTFDEVDSKVFPAIELARYAIKASYLHPAVYNAANEKLIELFSKGSIKFLDIVRTIGVVLEKFDNIYRAGKTAQEKTAQKEIAPKKTAQGEIAQGEIAQKETGHGKTTAKETCKITTDDVEEAENWARKVSSEVAKSLQKY
jgi:1-deoxy-D-xylulose-5-phosphate reductoisomerase